MEENHN